MKHVFKKLFFWVFLICFIYSPMTSFSQQDVLDTEPPAEYMRKDIDPGCDPLDEDCPIDGGLSALLALGAGYGIKKIRQARKEVDPE